MAAMSPLRQRMIEDMTIRNLSPQTQRSYVQAVARFSKYFGRSPDRLSPEEVRAYQLHLISRGIAWSSVNQVTCALRFFFGTTLGRGDIVERIVHARQARKLPVVLSREEVVRFLEAVPGLTARMALTTAYAAGLRLSEVVALKAANIDSQRMVIQIERGKGGHERQAMLSVQLLHILRVYWRIVHPAVWLFPGRNPEHPISSKTLGTACEIATEAAGLSKHVTVHTLRHSFATHLLESGTDIRIIQVLLGHKHLSSTALYTQVATATIANTRSPLDRLDLNVIPPG
jgi:integrase/recombinase XerD